MKSISNFIDERFGDHFSKSDKINPTDWIVIVDCEDTMIGGEIPFLFSDEQISEGKYVKHYNVGQFKILEPLKDLISEITKIPRNKTDFDQLKPSMIFQLDNQDEGLINAKDK